MANARLYDPERPGRVLGVRVVGTGSYVPERIVTNQDLAKSHGFSDDWIFTRTGIRQRRFALPRQATSDLCYEAALCCLEEAAVRREEVDLLVVATYTPDMCFPATACLVQSKLGLSCAAFDLEAACSGFIYALVTASQFIATGSSRYALVIGGDVNSRILNPRDQRTFPLFGDGAGAVLLGPADADTGQGILAFSLGADGGGGGLLSRPACGSRMPPTPERLDEGLHYLQMQGREIFKLAVNEMTGECEALLNELGIDADEIKLVVPHQANARILDSVARHLGVADRIHVNIAKVGNTVSASIPLALEECATQGKLKRGDLVLLTAFGAGLTWGAAVVRW